MKILCIGDIHFKLNSSIPQFNKIEEDGKTVELNRAVKSLQWIEKEIEKHKPDIVIQLGDVFHTLDKVDSVIVVEAFKSFQSLYNTIKQINSHLYIIGGNHDKAGNNYYLTEILPSDKHFSDTETIEFKNCKLTFIPYKEPEHLIYEDILSNSHSDFIFTHTQIKGIYYNKQKRVETGLSENYLSRLNYLISGHIHIPQQYKNAYFTGSLYQNIPSEQPIDIPFGATLITIEKDNVEFKQLENNAVKKLKTLYILSKEDIPEDLDKYKDYLIKVVTSDKEVIAFLETTDLDYYVVPYNDKKQYTVQYINDYTHHKSSTEIMLDYISSKYPYLENYIKKYIGE